MCVITRLLRPATSTLRPRSGKEYQNIDRSMLSLHHGGGGGGHHLHLHQQQHLHHPSSNLQPSQLRGLLNCSVNYANITPVPENAESPSPGYQSGSSPQEPDASMFMYKVGFIFCERLFVCDVSNRPNVFLFVVLLVCRTERTTCQSQPISNKPHTE